MATKTKKASAGKKPALAKPAGFTDKDGHALAVGDRVQYDSLTSPHSGGKGTITAIHEREWSVSGTVATVLLDKLSTWKEAPSVAALPESLTWLETPPPTEKPELPWLDCDGNMLLEGDKATVLPDVSKRLSGKLVKVLGDYDPIKKSVQVEPVGWDGEPFGILLCFLKRLPVLAEQPAEPVIQSGITSVGSPSPEVAAEFKQAALMSVLVATQAPAKDVARAQARRQEPVAPFALVGQAAYEAAQPAPPEPHRIGWATKSGSQLNHHYDAQGLTACGYKRKAGELSFASSPDSLSRWQRCEKCDAKLTPAAPATEQPAPVAMPKKTTTFEDFQKILETHSAGLRVLPLASITITRNTRKVFDEAALAELAESIKAHGVLQPIVVRPAAEAGHYELVAGERRYRAALAAGLAEIPATVRNLTDREFLEVQLLENLQRVDVRPADEAQAFAELLRNGFSAEEVALKVGKGEKFVLQRAKLASLIPFWFEALAEGRLPLVAGHELARLPAHSQLVIKKADPNQHSHTSPYTTREISGLIQREILRELAQAPFPTEDATLVPAAGTCSACPKRSGACGLLFDEADPKDKCLDANCYQSKVEAFVKRRIVELTVNGKKPLLITGNYESKDKNVLGTKHYSPAYDGYKGGKQVHEALQVEGHYIGQLKRITLYADTGKSDAEISNQKQVDAARLRKERHTKTHRVLIAEKLTADLPAALDQPDGPVFGAMLDHLLLEVCSTSKDVLAYLRESWGWEPDEVALENDYKGKDAQGFWPWQQYVRQTIRPLGWQSKLELYLAIKVRHRMNYDYEDAQFTLAKLIGGHGYPELDQAADEAVEARYYTKKGKKQEATV